MKINIIKASLQEKSIIQNMMQLYQYDFSEFEEMDLNDHGMYNYKYLDHYWTEDNRTPFIIHVDEKLAGFVLVNKHSYSGEDAYCIAEFFVMRKYRRKNIGKEVAYDVFDKFGPSWEIGVTKNNMAAQKFWRKIVDEYTEGNFKEYPDGIGDWKGLVFTFNKGE